MKGVWALAFWVNLFLLLSVFDIHFKSPIVAVSKTHRAEGLAPHPRLVFIVADGLRADTFFQNPQLRPYLSSLMAREDDVAFGISDTRVPTESRPGHIALFAGFYEDPSAVFTGWKHNLVEFDSVFNRSRGAVALGSPDVVNMFAQGEARSKVYSETYSADWQDFLAANSSFLDTWVFERFQRLVKEERLPKHDGFLLFLHLLGIDNTGHATKPQSKEYKDGLLVVDNIVRQVEGMIKDYYGDEKTLFVFTSDHGMTDWGSHGSGSAEETETPIVVWGTGIRKTETMRIKQGDVTPLVAGALGTSFPTNSVGKFPSFLWKDSSQAYSTLRANFLQVLELAKTKKAHVALERNFPLVEFPDEINLSVALANADALAKAEDIERAIFELEKAFELALIVNKYYERYNETLMIICSVLTFVFLMTVVASCILAFSPLDKELRQSSFIFDWKLSCKCFLLSLIFSKGIIGWSIWKVGYCFVPIYLILLWTLKIRQKIAVTEKTKLAWSLGLSVFGVQTLVLSFWMRGVLSGALIFNLMWALHSQPSRGNRVKSRRKDLLMQVTGVGILALFPAVPIIGQSRSPFFMTLGPLISSCIVGFSLFFPDIQGNPHNRLVLAIQLFLQSSAAFLSHFPTFSGTRIMAWTSLMGALLAPTMTSSKTMLIRLLSIFLALGTPFSYLGISYETCFFPALFAVLIIFLKLELDEQAGQYSDYSSLFSLSRSDRHLEKGSESSKVNLHRAFRRAWFHLFFVLLSFFGTGNIGSLSSFDPSSTRCFLSVFSPWLMMLLMLAKVLAPFLLVSSFWQALLPSKEAVERNFGILLLLSQGMSLTMFFKVRNKGSWLDIGMSISHFVIVQVTTLFLLIFHFISHFLVTYQLLPTARPLPTRTRRDIKTH